MRKSARDEFADTSMAQRTRSTHGTRAQFEYSTTHMLRLSVHLFYAASMHSKARQIQTLAIIYDAFVSMHGYYFAVVTDIITWFDHIISHVYH